MEKTKVLFTSDFADSGFGTVGKELCKRLAETELFEVFYLGWYAQPSDAALANALGFQLITTQFWDQADQHGAKSWDKVIEAVRPEVVLSLGDPWMVEHIGHSRHRDHYQWVCYMPIDRDWISRSWIKIMEKPNVLVLYSQFGMDVVEAQMPFRNPVLILHGVDKTVFRPLQMDVAGGQEGDRAAVTREGDWHEAKDRMKASVLGQQFAGKFIVGFVGRNQVRKAIPRFFKSFKAFNCATWIERQDVNITNGEGAVTDTFPAEEFCKFKQKFRCDLCPAFQQRPESDNAIMYLHTTRGDGSDMQDRPGIGWYIDELADRYGYRGKGKLGMTPGFTVLKGLPREGLARIMNCFDIHLFPSHSEGFGLPIVETVACGVPTLCTDYSSMPELVRDGGGEALEVVDYDTHVTWENEWASNDIGDTADKINKYFEDPELREKVGKEGVANKYIPDWEEVALQFRDLLLKLVGRGQ